VILFLSIVFLIPSLTQNVSSLPTSTETIVSKVSKQLELPAGSDYYIKFSAVNLTLNGQDIEPYAHGLSETVLAAIAKAPQWIQYELTRQFHTLNTTEEYATLLLNASRRYADEIAFCIACSPQGNVPSAALIYENVQSLYERDQWIQYAEIVDYDDGAGNYYSTIRYTVLENGEEKQVVCPPEIYYWYVVHPKLGRGAVDPVYGTLWRSYLFDHNDLGYPLLKEKLSSIQYLWDCESYYQPGSRLWTTCINQHPTAIEAISYWVGKTVPYQATGDRPNQPNIIAHEHNGWCGELQVLAVAAQRAALVPSIDV
jgi:hypothetical protein